MQSRLGDAALESIQPLQPISAYFSPMGNTPPTYSLTEAVQDIIAAIRAGLLLIDEATFLDFVQACEENAADMKAYGDPTELSVAEIASLLLFTAEFPNPSESPYKVLNSCFRSRDRTLNRPFIRFIWLMLHALKKCESFETTGSNLVYRGMTGGVDISGYIAGRTITWSQFSSCTSDLHVQQTFVGQAGPRVLFNIELTTGRGKAIQRYSFHQDENEVSEIHIEVTRFEFTLPIIFYCLSS